MSSEGTSDHPGEARSRLEATIPSRNNHKGGLSVAGFTAEARSARSDSSTETLPPVAVVDGRRTLHDLISAALRAAGFPVTEYEARNQFLIDYAWERPRIVVIGAFHTDADVSQEAAVKTLLLSRPRPLLPILLFAPSATDNNLARAAAIAGTEVLPLPLTPDGIVAAVRRVAAKSD